MTETTNPRPLMERRWPLWLAVTFVLLTLVSLVMVPWIVQHRVAEMRQRIEASEPARTLVMQWQVNLVREMSALGELLLTGDPAQLDVYSEALADERVLHRELEPLAAFLGPHVVQRLLEARGLADRWHGRVQTDDAAPRDEAAGRVPRERQLFAQVMTAVAALDSTIVQETLSVRTEIVAAESTGLRITLGLGLLALAAGIAVLALQARVRNSAEEAERRRVVAAEALAESAQVAEARARLLRGITHDVKNPLGAAKGYAELLSMGIKAPLDPAQIPLVEGIGRSIDTALAIIADLLDLSRVDSVGISVKRVETDLNDIVREAMEDHRAAAESAGHRMDAELAGGPVLAYTDPGRVRQVLDNLLSNAIKYTPPPGTITVRAGSYDGARPPAPGAWSTIIVCDTGPGIPVEQREAVFDEFTRLDEGSAKGHGLGLAIARGLARQLGGDLTIAGSGPGATFVLWIAQRDQPAVHDNRRAGQATPGSAAGGGSA